MKDLVLLVGGRGTRLGSLTKKTPKCLIEIQNKPFLYYLFKKFEKENIKNIFLCSKYKSTLIKNFLETHNFKRLNIKIFNDGKEFHGTGGSIKKILKYLNDDFFVQNGDTFLNLNYEKIIKKDDYEKSIICYSKFKYNTLNIPNLLIDNNKILNYDKIDFAKNNSIDAGLYLFKKKHFNEINLSKFDLSIFIKKLIKKQKLKGYRIERKFYEIGSLKGLADFSKYINNNHKLF